MGRRERPVLSVWDVDAVTAAFEAANVKTTHLRPLHGWLLRHPHVRSWEEIGEQWSSEAQLRNIPEAARLLLSSKFAVSSSRIEARDESADGATTKLAVSLSDGLRVETVLMRHGNRTTVCVSSQVGCAMGCTFCATGTMGIVGDLSAGEIVEQLLHCRRVEFESLDHHQGSSAAATDDHQGSSATAANDASATASVAARRPRSSVRNVVFMGMGEPLNNYRAVCSAVRLLIEPALFGLRPSSVTVSTVGIVPRMRTFRSHLPGVSLALSLHAATQPKREAIMPAARAYPLSRLMPALEGHLAEAKAHTPTSKVAMVEYILLRDVNDTAEDAAELAELLGPHAGKLMLNLIPYNPTDATPEYRRTTEAVTANFMATLRAANVLTMVRKTMGDDIAGACGQLVRQQERHYAAKRAAQAPDQPADYATAEAEATLALDDKPVNDIEDLIDDMQGGRGSHRATVAEASEGLRTAAPRDRSRPRPRSSAAAEAGAGAPVTDAAAGVPVADMGAVSGVGTGAVGTGIRAGGGAMASAPPPAARSKQLVAVAVLVAAASIGACGALAVPPAALL